MDKTRKNERALEHEAAVAEADDTATGIDEPAAPAAGTLNAALLNPKADIAVLDALENELFALGYTLGEIISFADVIDPDGATEDRGEALAYLVQKRQEALCAPEIGAVLDRLEANPAILNEKQAAEVKILKRDRAQLVDVPVEEQAALSRLQNESSAVWHKAKLADDWASFEPYLDQIVEAQIRIAGYKNAGKDPYDVWLDEYEHGTDRTFYDEFFTELKDTVVPLLADVVAADQPTEAVEGTFGEGRQWALARELVKLEGLDMDRLWLGATEHPFTGGPGRNFVIVTGHAHEDDVLSNVYSILHEGGHALYEQNVDEKLNRTCLCSGTSCGMHEAQSRFFENYIGRSKAFARPLLEIMKRHFPGPLGRLTPNQLYIAANRAEPSLIRTEADELTYPLHIIVRYEIEQLLFSGEAKAADVPRLWKERYKSYLGVDVPDYQRGPLQDVHWSQGSFGYFPTYALGSAYGAQLKYKMVEDGVDFDGACGSGDLAPIRAWLGHAIWRHGRSKDSAELIQGACGEPFSAHYFCDYLREKFSSLYRLKA
ncbi:carboxypeptidase M32 [Coriobacteriales bacterium OH1046]|nr:carboxypeptidase M32 [Coriobacteriales bacterium OH1046]